MAESGEWRVEVESGGGEWRVEVMEVVGLEVGWRLVERLIERLVERFECVSSLTG